MSQKAYTDVLKLTVSCLYLWSNCSMEENVSENADE